MGPNSRTGRKPHEGGGRDEGNTSTCQDARHLSQVEARMGDGRDSATLHLEGTTLTMPSSHFQPPVLRHKFLLRKVSHLVCATELQQP